MARRFFDRVIDLDHPRVMSNGSKVWFTHGPFHELAKATSICPDGKTRVAWVSGEWLDNWTVPATVQYRHKTVSGRITLDEGAGGYVFHSKNWLEEN